ncbi:glucosamine--fructose-6-phosphate aminotransferase (isomerizing) [Allopseudospirillum japonicum]|uniref:Glutamine--fructose-6-phosphate aminotransferase [isomerizing] n=1 Tax=Allopseudospirillum japonicum TaxID=64971 RepID=A0A1H6R9K8_9GAMM|nr:glutamine--fructose-6-phosphate transaminase (isomerizing) [Allopseudospirillum japonicum]SEI52433.1 glucosamine--fructose-6-phosphate aminotransferase (isomerizing) [Allopseudospirillum japonicum]
MCGIVGAVAERTVTPILLEGLRRLEYRGYDSAGLAVIAPEGLQRQRAVGKVAQLEKRLETHPLRGMTGIAHTRWATHGAPTEVNAHPHMSGSQLAVVHNGIIENYASLRQRLQATGYTFESQTDTEVIAHLIEKYYQQSGDLFVAVQQAIILLEGAFAIAVVHQAHPEYLVCARKGSPLVLGVGSGESFCASDPLALLQVTDRFIYLQEGDIACLSVTGVEIVDQQGQNVERPMKMWEHGHQAADKQGYKHYMLKEIHEQPKVMQDTLEGRISQTSVLPEILGSQASLILPHVEQVHVIACGTSFHAGMVARYWIEKIAGLPCMVEVASEYRYRDVVVPPNTLFVCISQSGETADTLAALRFARQAGYLATLAICNVPGSSLIRETDLALMTRAGPEIGVASTKAFTTQLIALMLLTLVLRRVRQAASRGQDTCEQRIVSALHALPDKINRVLALDEQIEAYAQSFADKQHALFLGRGTQYPIAMEGALKLKEISYIHAEAYPAGELKHGPLALVDKEMPVVAIAPHDDLLEKLKSNLQEVQARGGQVLVFADGAARVGAEMGLAVLHMPEVIDELAPILYTLPLQLLAYHVAVLKGTDVDQPRNLAKSVTVE